MTSEVKWTEDIELVAAYDYDLPAELIAQEPVEPRDASRLMVVHRKTGTIEHRVFSDLPEYLAPGTVLMMNDTKVLPARLVGRKETGGRVEILLLRRRQDGLWEALAKPSRRLRPGTELDFGAGLRVVMEGYGPEGTRLVRLRAEGDELAALARVGEVPLPPYIHRRLDDPERYQTVYAQHAGSAAAPTAGLHFTPRLLERLASGGVRREYVTLHVGLGTFRPVTVERVDDHVMHSEWYEVSERAARAVDAARREGKPVVAVGTTTCRTLESAATDDGRLLPGTGETDLFIRPGFRFRVTDALITNFHLPRSSLLMLVAAFAGYDLMRRAYQVAVEERYRFFSFGDAMLIL